MISCQFSLYPLGTDELSAAIDAGLAALTSLGIAFEVGAISTHMTGESAVVFEGLSRAFNAAALQGQIVMTATLSNACPLPEN